MTFFNEDEKPPLPAEQEISPPSAAEPGAADLVSAPPELPLAGDPISLAATVPRAAPSYGPSLPEDLRISWSWLHFVVFLFFGVVSFFLVQVSFMIY
jgi:hypothetical protein